MTIIYCKLFWINEIENIKLFSSLETFNYHWWWVLVALKQYTIILHKMKYKKFPFHPKMIKHHFVLKWRMWKSDCSNPKSSEKQFSVQTSQSSDHFNNSIPRRRRRRSSSRRTSLNLSGVIRFASQAFMCQNVKMHFRNHSTIIAKNPHHFVLIHLWHWSWSYLIFVGKKNVSISWFNRSFE